VQALDFSLHEPARVVIAGPVESTGGRALLRAVHSIYQPNKVVLGVGGPVEEFARSLPAGDGAQAFLCSGTSCQAPTSDPEKLRELLGHA
jgi:uncharacterized protein YyaL (SSP411 family)